MSYGDNNTAFIGIDPKKFLIGSIGLRRGSLV